MTPLYEAVCSYLFCRFSGKQTKGRPPLCGFSYFETNPREAGCRSRARRHQSSKSRPRRGNRICTEKHQITNTGRVCLCVCVCKQARSKQESKKARKTARKQESKQESKKARKTARKQESKQESKKARRQVSNQAR